MHNTATKGAHSMNHTEILHTSPDIEAQKLDAIRAALAIGKFASYPDNQDRLVCDTFQHDQQGRIIIPEGPWETDREAISAERYKALQDRGISFDSEGRPLHPLFREMVQDPSIGVVTGKGFFWEFGPNETADAVIIRRDLGDEPWVLLIQRSDTKQLAFIGGFLEGKTALETAIAEPKEEAFIALEGIAHTAVLAHRSAVADIRTTAHAWTETNVYVLELPDEMAATHRPGELIYDGGDDAIKALWVPFSHAEELVHPGHKLLGRAVAPTVLTPRQ